MKLDGRKTGQRRPVLLHAAATLLGFSQPATRSLSLGLVISAGIALLAGIVLLVGVKAANLRETHH
ncbi:hypothetical protein AB0F91_38145 [Amycolatopsis sp. NPDC023774]|uniref:hypothetical protein n=1 Tax=Amycolatopsis sp. NPDC023774 TaxID=3155015 RepID=UPI0033E84252